MKSLSQHQAEQLKNQNLKQVDNMSSYEYYKEKYKNYERENSFKGWIRHIYLVCLSMMIKQPH
jgi:hypothetical protein